MQIKSQLLFIDRDWFARLVSLFVLASSRSYKLRNLGKQGPRPEGVGTERSEHEDLRDTSTYLAPHDNYMSLLSSRDCVAIRHPGQVPQSGTRAGIQFDYIELSLDSGSRPP